MARSNKSVRVNTMYGADGKLRTSYIGGSTKKDLKKNVKSFNKEIARYEKDFETYMNLGVEDITLSDANTKYVLGKLDIARRNAKYVTAEDMAEVLGDEVTAIAGSKSGHKVGVKAKIANIFQPFCEKQSEKHAGFKKISDRVTKAANNGRMPLTADSAAMMRIAFDKKYYDDCRKPGADVAELYEAHKTAVENLAKMAQYDGITPKELSDKFSEKLINQMQYDETLTDIYAGMATGEIRLADNEPILDAKGNPLKIKGQTLYKTPDHFVSAEKGRNGKNIELDAWNFEPRQPQSVESIIDDYQSQMRALYSKCETTGDIKRMLDSDTYANIKRNAEVFSEDDCPDDTEKFEYELKRANAQNLKDWAQSHGNAELFASIEVPPPFDKRSENPKGTTSEYYSIDDDTPSFPDNDNDPPPNPPTPGVKLDFSSESKSTESKPAEDKPVHTNDADKDETSVSSDKFLNTIPPNASESNNKRNVSSKTENVADIVPKNETLRVVQSSQQNVLNSINDNYGNKNRGHKLSREQVDQINQVFNVIRNARYAIQYVRNNYLHDKQSDVVVLENDKTAEIQSFSTSEKNVLPYKDKVSSNTNGKNRISSLTNSLSQLALPNHEDNLSDESSFKG